MKSKEEHPMVKEAKELGLWLRHGRQGAYSWHTPEEYQKVLDEGRIWMDEQFLHMANPEDAIIEARNKITEMQKKLNEFEDRVRSYYKGRLPS